MTEVESDRFDWGPFAGRALAYVCIHLGGLDKKSLVERADFLMALGLPRREAALILGSTDDSLRVMKARAKSSKKGSVA